MERLNELIVEAILRGIPSDKIAIVEKAVKLSIEYHGDTIMKDVTLEDLIEIVQTPNINIENHIDKYLELFHQEIQVFINEHKIIQFYTEMFDDVHRRIMLKLDDKDSLWLFFEQNPDTLFYIKKFCNDQLISLFRRLQSKDHCH
jgi:hypothetical protein